MGEVVPEVLVLAQESLLYSSLPGREARVASQLAAKL